MKKFLIVLICLIATNKIYSQSVSITKIYSFLENQDDSFASSNLEKIGFEYVGNNYMSGISMNNFSIDSYFGNEKISIGKNSELYMVAYNVSTKAIYDAYEEKSLTSEFNYAYSYKNVKYYESQSMRIGLNPNMNIISYFVTLK